MRARKSPSRGVVIGVLAGISAVGGTVAYGAATAPSPPVPYIIHACWNPKQGAWASLRISRYNQVCPTGWVNIGWMSSGKNGARGPQGPRGAAGPRGIGGAGFAGVRGAAGVTGATGVNGNTVLSGPGDPPEGTCVTGDFWINTTSWSMWNCVDGAWTGPVSLVGPQGPTGIQGATGANGVQGATGADGNQGATGSQGPIGPQGPIGNQGVTGASGPQGATGSSGQTGSNGLQGSTGAPGGVGLQGTTGPAGPTGASGPQGSTGSGFSTANITYHAYVGATGDQDVEAYCPTGKVALGGGYYVFGSVGKGTGNPHLQIQAGASFPVNKPGANGGGFSGAPGATGSGTPTAIDGTGTANGWAFYFGTTTS